MAGRRGGSWKEEIVFNGWKEGGSWKEGGWELEGGRGR